MASPPVRRRPLAAQQKTVAPVQERGRAIIQAVVKQGKNEVGSTFQEQELEAELFSVERPAAFVRVAAGLTISPVPYESIRVDIAVTLPCYPEHVSQCYSRASDLVAEFMDEEHAKWVPQGRPNKSGGR